MPQRHGLSCESRAACDLLAAYGRPADEDAFLAALPRSDNPDLGFVGDPDGPPGRLPPEAYGVHAEPVARCLQRFGVPARAERGRDAAWLRARLAEGSPVIAWVTGDFVARVPESRVDAAGRAFRCVPWEHAVLVVGHDESAVKVVDPALGDARQVPWGRFLSGWASLEGMAVWVPGASRNLDAWGSHWTSAGNTAP